MDKRLEAYDGRRVLVTGDTGFKGGWLSIWLYELGAHVIGYALDPPTDPNFFTAVYLDELVEHINGDIRNEIWLEKTISEYQPEIIFHLAAQPLVRASYLEPKLTYETNVLGTVNLLEVARKTKSVKACIIVTSDKCYENKNQLYSYREDDVLGGSDPYSSSKACAELVVSAYQRSFFTNIVKADNNWLGLVTARAGNVIGGGDWGQDRIIPDCMRALSMGADIRIRNPYSVRPWQYILEPLFGYLLLGAMLYKGEDIRGAWNFGPPSGESISVEDLVRLVIEVWGEGTYQIIADSEEEREAEMLQLDSTKASSFLGWHSHYGIDNTIRRAISWYRQFYLGADVEKLRRISLEEISIYQDISASESLASSKRDTIIQKFDGDKDV